MRLPVFPLSFALLPALLGGSACTSYKTFVKWRRWTLRQMDTVALEQGALAAVAHRYLDLWAASCSRRGRS